MSTDANENLGPCIRWNQSLNAYGYGQTYFQGRVCAAHRAAYCKHHGLEIGAISGKVIRHRCDNPACVNPDHLVIGSQADNVRDMISRGRMNSDRSNFRGSAWSFAKLHESQIPEIRRMLEAGISQRKIAAVFGVHQATISSIARGKSWSHA